MRVLRWFVKIAAAIKQWLGNRAEKKDLERRKKYQQIQEEYKKRRMEKLMKQELEMFE